MFQIYLGTISAYDEALARYRQPLYPQVTGASGEVEADEVLAAAVWRNVWDAREDTDLAMLTTVTKYVRRTLSELDKLPDETVMEAEVVFGDPREEVEESWGVSVDKLEKSEMYE